MSDSAPTSGDQQLHALEEELKALTESPPANVAAALEKFFERIMALPADFEPGRLAELHTFAAFRYYLNGQNLYRALVPLSRAKRLAEPVADRNVVRKAFLVSGLVRGATGDTPGGLEDITRALRLSEELGNGPGMVAAWTGISAVLMDAKNYADGRAAAKRALEIEVPEGVRSYLFTRVWHSLANASLFTGTYSMGLAEISQTVAYVATPQSPEDWLVRALAESTWVQLLLALGRIEEATAHVAQAREAAERARAERAMISAETASALAAVYRGDFEQGLKGLHANIDRARHLQGAYFELLRAMVDAYEKAGQPDEALKWLDELIRTNRQAQAQEIQLLQRLIQQGDSLATTPLDSSGPFWEESQTRLRAKRDARLALLTNMAIDALIATGHDLYRVFRVSKLAGLFAASEGWIDDQINALRQGVRLMDIGLVALDQRLLLQSRELTPAERRIVNRHTTEGADLLLGAGFPLVVPHAELARTHHERWDGSGPNGLAGEAIPGNARLVALCDSFDAMLQDRPWRTKLSVQAALNEVSRGAGTKYDPVLAPRFVKWMREFYWEHEDFMGFLASDAKDSEYVRSREQLSALLHESAQ